MKSTSIANRATAAFGILGWMLIIFAGCDSAQSTQAPEMLIPPPAAAESEVVTAIDALFEQQGTIAFAPSADREIDSTSRMTLTLLPTGVARLDYNGGETESASGRFAIDTADRLQLDFGPDDPWLPMQVTIDEELLSIHAPEKAEIIQAAVASGIEPADITDEDIAAAFEQWPLQQVTAD